MKKKKLLIAIPLVAMLLSGCDVFTTSKDPSGETQTEKKEDKDEQHTHAYVEHAAKEATCTEDGNAKYFSCEGCNKIFNESMEEVSMNDVVVGKLGHNLINHPEVAATCETSGNSAYDECDKCDKFFDKNGNEIPKNSWVLAPIGHEYRLDVSGTYKTNYKSGDVFDKNGVVVKKVCDHEGCENPEILITDFDIVYQNEDATSIGVTDTKVIVKVGDLTEEIAISVEKIANVITGMSESYTCHCKEGIDLTGISASMGEISAKYYYDAECTQEVALENLIEGDYFVKVTSDGVDPAYDVASKVATLTVSHDCEEKTPSDVIGYKTNVCKYCDNETSSTTLMADSDIVLCERNALGDIVANYGMNTSSFPKDVANQEADFPRHPQWIDESSPSAYTAAETTVNVALPKVNYKLFTSVDFIWDSTDDMTGQVYKLGVVTDGDLLDTTTQAVHGSIKVTYQDVDGGKLLIEMKSIDEKGKVVNTVDSDDIIEGVENLTLKFTSTWSRQFHLRKILLNHVAHTGDGVLTASKEVIGYKTEHCVDCAEAMESTTLMTEQEIQILGNDNKNNYGMNAKGCTEASTEGAHSIAGMPMWEESQGVNLPKVNFKAYQTVSYRFYSSSETWGGGYIGFGINADDDLLAYSNHGVALNGIIKVVYENSKLTITCETTDGVLGTQILDDDNVASGKSNLVLKFHGTMYRSMFISAVLLIHVHTPSDSLLLSNTKVIGYKAKACSGCGLATDTLSTTKMTNSDIDLANGYGAGYELISGTADSSIQRITHSASKIIYEMNPMTPSYEANILLPKVNYALYDDVKFSFTVATLWGSIGLDASNKYGSHGDGNGLGFTVEVLKQNSGDRKIVLEFNNGQKFESMLTDNLIINGAKSVALYGTPGGYTCFSLTEISINETCQHNTKYVAKGYIGNSVSACTKCGNINEQATRLTQSADIDYSFDNLGANMEYLGTAGWNLKTSGNYDESWSTNAKIIAGTSSYTCKQSIEGANYKLSLPKVKYSLYSTVEFPVHFDDGYKIGYGISLTVPNIWSEIISGSDCEGGFDATVKIIVLDNNLLKVTLTTTKHSISLAADITDANIFNGDASLPIYMSSKGYDNGIVVGRPTLTPALNQTDKGQIKFIKGGAHYDDAYIVENGAELTPGAFKFTPDRDYTDYEITLPAIKLSGYSYVSYKILMGDAHYGVKFTGNPWTDTGDDTIHGTNLHLTLSISKVSDSEYVAVLSNGTINISNTITDADIISGTKGISFVYGTASTASVYVYDMVTSVEHVHTFNQSVYSSIGGTVTKKCSGCGEAGDSREFTSSDLNYANSLFGCSGDKFVTSVDSGKIKVSGTHDYGAATALNLPKVNFAKYSQVVFTIEGYTEYGYSLNGMSYDDGKYKGQQTLTLTFVIEDGTITATLSDGTTSENKTITDADILSGEKAVSLLCRTGERTDCFTISVPSLTAK